MRKNILALSIAASIGSLAGFANANVITNGATATGLSAAQVGGIGHILVVPYFTTQGSKQTLLNLVNTDLNNAKAVKVRYRGAANSDDIFDITLYLSPGDVWTGTVTANGTISKFLTSDTSCTLPSKEYLAAGNNGNFQTGRVRNADPLQTREGYIEILNTADIPATRIANGATVATANPLFDAVKHGAYAAPSCNAGVMLAQAVDINTTGGDANNYVHRGYQNPTGGLMANWTIVDLAKNSTTTGEALSIRTTGGAAANIVWFPQMTTPVAQANTELWTADPLLTIGAFKTSNTTGGPIVVGGATEQDFPDLSTPYAGTDDAEMQAARLTAALSTTAVTNEFITDGNFSTDWVLSMPTRRYHMAANYAGTGSIVFNPSLRTNTDRSTTPVARNGAGGNPVSLTAAGGTGLGFGWFNATNAIWNPTLAQICVVPGRMRSFDREENEANVFTVSPGTSLQLCGETNVISFNGKDSVLGAAIALSRVTTLDPVVTTRNATGWSTIATPAATANATGLPITGYAAIAFSGNNLGGTWLHR